MYRILKNGGITLPRGDTLCMKIDFTGGEFPEGTVVIFGVCSSRDGRTLLSKVFKIVDNSVVIRLSNVDTRKLPVNTYRWDLRIVTDPEYNEDGSVYCNDNSDDVMSLFSGGGMPPFIVTEVAVHV